MTACDKLQKHFGQANEDIEQILISAEKIEKRGEQDQQRRIRRRSEPHVIPAPVRSRGGE